MKEKETAPVFTDIDLDNWRAYERVRKSGKWNMFFPEARRASGLEDDDYSFCIRWYSELKEAATKKL